MDEDWVVKVTNFAAERIRMIDFAFRDPFNEDRGDKIREEHFIHSSWGDDIVLKQLEEKQLVETKSDSVDSDIESSTMEFGISADSETSEGEMEDEDEPAEEDAGGKTLVDQLNDSTSTNAISEKVSIIDSARQKASRKKYTPKSPAIFLPQMRIFSGSGKSRLKGHVGILRQQKAKITLYKWQLALGRKTARLNTLLNEVRRVYNTKRAELVEFRRAPWASALDTEFPESVKANMKTWKQ